MNRDFQVKTLKSLTFQRNMFAGLSALLGVSVLVSSSFLFLKQDRIVVVPPSLEKPFWIEGSRVSNSYLEQHGVFLGELLLNRSVESAPQQRAILLRQASPEFISALKVKLVQEEETLKKQGASYAFFPTGVEVDGPSMRVRLTGDRVFFVGGQQVSCKRESYTLSLKVSGGRVLLNGVTSSEQSV